MNAQPDESPARQGLRRLQVLAELESRGAALIPLADLERLRDIARRAQEAYDSDIWINGKDAAHYILHGEAPY